MSKKKVKENPLIKNNNVGRIKGGSGALDEGNEIKRFVIIIVILALLVGGIYLLTALVSKEKKDFSYSSTIGEVNYDKVAVGTILNRKYDEYYVLVYDFTKEESIKYAALASVYTRNKKEDDYIKIYLCDLDNQLNKPYYNVNNDNKSNPKAKKVSEFDFGDLTLLHIKKGKITEYIEDYKTIQEKLS